MPLSQRVPSSPRYPFQFTVRTLLALMALTAAVGTYFSSVRMRFGDQMLAVKEIERRGGSVATKPPAAD